MKSLFYDQIRISPIPQCDAKRHECILFWRGIQKKEIRKGPNSFLYNDFFFFFKFRKKYLYENIVCVILTDVGLLISKLKINIEKKNKKIKVYVNLYPF